MSLHATTPATEALLRRQRKISMVTSSIISLLAVILILLVFSIFMLAPVFDETTEFVTYESGMVEEPEKDPRQTPLSRERKPAAPSASKVNVIAAQTVSTTAVPTIDVTVETPSLDFGTGDDFGDGWSTGDDSGIGGGASFFNQKVTAKRVAYVIDYSLSMSGVRDRLMREELEKSIRQLGSGMQFQMIFFAGPVWVAGQQVSMREKNRLATVKDGEREYEWKTDGGANTWKPVGTRHQPEWLTVTSSNLQTAVDHIRKTRLVWGTIWDHPLEMALSMEPKPDVIFFMTDGMAGSNTPDVAKEIGRKARSSNVVINTVALMVPKAQEPLKDLAKRSRGQFTIVKEGGKAEVVPLN
jgi:hypothetical protein